MFTNYAAQREMLYDQKLDLTPVLIPVKLLLQGFEFIITLFNIDSIDKSFYFFL